MCRHRKIGAEFRSASNVLCSSRYVNVQTQENRSRIQKCIKCGLFGKVCKYNEIVEKIKQTLQQKSITLLFWTIYVFSHNMIFGFTLKYFPLKTNSVFWKFNECTTKISLYKSTFPNWNQFLRNTASEFLIDSCSSEKSFLFLRENIICLNL